MLSSGLMVKVMLVHLKFALSCEMEAWLVFSFRRDCQKPLKKLQVIVQIWRVF